eukprot:CAMPEP_0172911344 /NCGR_PEP_ID=MMETSP1075-20121228/186288_1 /TAXON_ID=2916 /ORGANISM="Ceratium fusus, Strain PA161109" /LENGTH=63 /DNA_ID=CAMNT_0013769635 /DNA_START=135 /DNA_END=326 /DNA_ORIENTATION=+
MSLTPSFYSTCTVDYAAAKPRGDHNDIWGKALTSGAMAASTLRGNSDALCMASPIFSVYTPLH